MSKEVYNPFVIGKYISDEYFCDREKETEFLLKQIRNGRNVVLVSPRRIGKSDLIHHLFHQKEMEENYKTLFVDIYATSSLEELVYLFGKAVFDSLKSKRQKTLEKFFNIISSLRIGFAIDSMTGEPSLNLSIGDIKSPETTLSQIFEYLQQADKPCVVAFDEFQQISEYKEKNVEALLRTYVQRCTNAQFIYSGSRRDMMSEMFQSAARPFYASSIVMNLAPISRDVYSEFAKRMFAVRGRSIEDGAVREVYDRYDGCTWFVQMMMNELFDMTLKGETCHASDISEAENNVIMVQSAGYADTMARLSPRQRELIIAIAKEREVERITSSEFVGRYNLSSASSVQSALRPMLASRLVTQDNNVYKVYDFFFAEWIRRRY